MQIRPPALADKDVILTFRREFMAKEPVLHGGNELNAFSDEGFIGCFNYINSPADNTDSRRVIEKYGGRTGKHRD